MPEVFCANVPISRIYTVSFQRDSERRDKEVGTRFSFFLQVVHNLCTLIIVYPRRLFLVIFLLMFIVVVASVDL